ncbi:MAG: peptidylprolyl isomerase [Polyangiales bacterium]
MLAPVGPSTTGPIFHRVIPGFMIRAATRCARRWGHGLRDQDENVNGHDAAGLLCMANHGPHTNGGQFFITEAPVTRLDGSYSIFGRCAPTSVVTQIATVPRSARDRPTQPVFIERVTIARAP